MPSKCWASLIYNGNITAINSNYDGYINYFGAGFKKNGSDNTYVLLGGGGHKAISDFSTSGHTHDGRYMRVYLESDVAPTSTNGYWSAMTTQSGISGDWWHIIHTAWNNAASWRSELALPTQGRNGVRYRSDNNGESGWTFGNWVKLLDENNWSNYCAAKSHTHSYAGSASAGGAANSANVLNLNSRMDYGWNGLNYFNANLTAGCKAKTNDSPTSNWWHIMRFNHKDSNGYYTDLAIPFNNSSLYWKCVRNGSLAHTSWVKILDSLNYNEYAPTKTGTGASGTWGISVTGNATTATTATKLSTSSAGSASLPVYFSNGIPVTCTKSSIFSNLSNNGDQLSVTVAGYNRLLTVAYASRANSATNANYATNADTLDGYHAHEFSLNNHTHTLKLESTTGASSINLAHGGKYELTAGESSIVFTLPSDITSIKFSGGLISSSGNTLTQANHSITIDGQTRTAGSSNCNIINSLSVSTLSSTATTNLSAEITVNGVISTLKTIAQLHSRFWDVTRNSATSNISPGNYSATITEVQGNASGITGN